MTTTADLASRVSELRALSPEAQVALGAVAVFLVLALFVALLRPWSRRHRGGRSHDVEGCTTLAPLPGNVMLVGSLLADAKRDFYDVQNGLGAFGAVALEEATGIPFVTDVFPRYFAGHFDAAVVLVHAMPQVDDASSIAYRDFSEYLLHHMSLHDAGAGSSRVLSFLEPFSGASSERAPGTGAATLELYLVPYPARAFATRKLAGHLFRHEYGRLLDVVTAYPRKNVIFCGAVFERLLEAHILDRIDHRFRLPTQAGLSKCEYRFSVIQLLHRGRIVRAAIAQSFAVKTTPISAYGRVCNERYAAR